MIVFFFCNYVYYFALQQLRDEIAEVTAEMENLDMSDDKYV